MTFCDCASHKDEHANDCLRLAIASVPVQSWEIPYEPDRALKEGTIFPSLNLPFFATGGEYHV